MELFKRIAFSVVYAPVMLVLFYLGGYYLLAALAIVAVIAMSEFRLMAEAKGYRLSAVSVWLSGIVFLVSALGRGRDVYVLFPILLILLLGSDVFRNRIEGAISRAGIAFLGLLYAAVMPSAMYRVNVLTQGSHSLILLLVLCWVTDTFAYFTGLTIGKHRGMLKASPNKSLEGFFGGFFFTTVIVTIIHFVLPDLFPLHILIAAAISAGIFGQIGDLMESLLKRDAGVKDSSHLFPGHGGVLDRFDSLFVAAPVFYIFLIYLA